MLNEFYRVSLRKKIYASLDALQADLDAWLDQYKQRARTSGTMVLWKNAYAHLPGLARTRQGETHPTLNRACHRSPQSHVRSSPG